MIPLPIAVSGALQRVLAVTLLSIFVLGCGDATSPQTSDANTPPPAVELETALQDNPAHTSIPCEAVQGIVPICGFSNPEDLVVIPDGQFLLVSEMATFMSDAPGELSLLDIAGQKRQAIEISWQTPADNWGDATCAAPDAAKFSPHGIDLITRADGRHEVLVVNHGDEQVDLFELHKPQDQWRLRWQGCAKPAGDPFMNDVAGLRDGGFVVTHMWNKGIPFEEVVARLTAGENLGWVWEWQPERGFSKVPNSDELMPNGIAVSKDNSKIFVNIYMGNKTLKMDRATGAVEAQLPVKSPDNVLVDDNGYVWIASHLNDPIEGRCEDGHAGPCLLPFQVLKANPDTMEAEVVLTHDGAPMGYVTVALPHQGRLYMGTASGDRLASIALP